MYYVVDFEICAAIFILLLIIITSVKKNVEDYQSKTYQAYLILTFVNLCLDVITCYTIEYYQVVPLWVNYLLNSIFLIGQFILPTLLMVYLHTNIANVRKVNSFMWKLTFLPCAIGVVSIFLNGWTRRIFYFDELGYHHGAGHYYLYENAIIYVFGTILYMLRARKYLKKKQFLMMSALIIVSIVPTIIQYFIPNYMLSGVGTAMSVFLIYMTNENMVDYMDQTTGALSREALLYHMSDARNKRMPEQVFVIALDNFKIINEIYGLEGGNRIMQMMVDSLQKEYSSKAVYRLGGDNFVVVIEERTEGAKELNQIRKIIGRKWLLDNQVVELGACIGLVHSIHHKEEDLFRAMEYAVSRAKQMGKGHFYEVEADAVDEMFRKTAIEQALVAAIDSGHFEVHYQPIFDVHSKCFHSMEALARLQVPGYGYVSPEEFISIAEQNGSIVQIGLLVLEEVCQFIKQYHLKQKGIRFVEVNLSTVQCMQDTIYQDIVGVLEKYQIPPSMINLEITESAAADSDELLKRNMARISLTDVTFSLDDYGSGYSNINYLVDLPFSIVKIDKYLVWGAMKKVTSRKILENMIKMFKAIDLKVVAEGIEDAEMANMVIEAGADYLQGYYYSKPVPKEVVMDCFMPEYLDNILNAKG